MKIISHRGASAYAPENTLAAFEKAVEMGAKDFEFDIHLTKDKIPVVHHDFHLLRTAGLQAEIADLNYSELKKINVSRHFSSDYKFQYIPKVQEVLEIIAPTADFINFEIKNDNNAYKGIEKIITDLVRLKKDVFKKAVLSCFDYPSAKRIRLCDKEVKMGYLGHSLTNLLLPVALKKAKAIEASSFHINHKIAFKMNIKKLHRAGLKVYAYTVDDFKDVLKMKENGVDGIFTNYPDII
ncbi:MAG: glycerophosphodiester phosphodiesterase family protein [Elusimicrobiota bacterium]|nr:glycerophosphodiester phosphodiesterase family protein [Elusimicrobiota bacterium]